MAAWTQLFGMISFELFGHFHNVIDDADPVVDRTLLEMGRLVGFPPPHSSTRPAEGAGGGLDDGDRGAPPDGEDEVWYLV